MIDMKFFVSHVVLAIFIFSIAGCVESDATHSELESGVLGTQGDDPKAPGEVELPPDPPVNTDTVRLYVDKDCTGASLPGATYRLAPSGTPCGADCFEYPRGTVVTIAVDYVGKRGFAPDGVPGVMITLPLPVDLRLPHSFVDSHSDDDGGFVRVRLDYPETIVPIYYLEPVLISGEIKTIPFPGGDFRPTLDEGCVQMNASRDTVGRRCGKGTWEFFDRSVCYPTSEHKYYVRATQGLLHEFSPNACLSTRLIFGDRSCEIDFPDGDLTNIDTIFYE